MQIIGIQLPRNLLKWKYDGLVEENKEAGGIEGGSHGGRWKEKKYYEKAKDRNDTDVVVISHVPSTVLDSL